MNREDKIEEFLQRLDIDNIDFAYHIDSEEVNSFEDIERAIEDCNGFDVEIIYYGRAMNYLIDNDCSLSESMGLAQELGYEAENITSELLASLLASQKCREDFYNYQDEIECFFEELEQEIEV